jgi:thymidine kinase
MITLIFGPMFSGKTSCLFAHYRRLSIAKKKIGLVKWQGDIRYSCEPEIVSHDGNKLNQNVQSVLNLQAIDKDWIDSVDAILIDEGQFYPDLQQFCELYASSKIIVIAALNSDYRQQPFASISSIIGMCDTIQHIKSVCNKCGEDAPFTVRLSEETEQQIIGAEDKYQPRCRKCLRS